MHAIKHHEKLVSNCIYWICLADEAAAIEQLAQEFALGKLSVRYLHLAALQLRAQNKRSFLYMVFYFWLAWYTAY